MAATEANIEEKNSYKNIFRATTLFGGVQVYQILVSVIRSKFVAVLLGPLGVGIQGLYQSTLQLVQSITSLGLAQSAVRNISEANGTGDMATIGKTVSAFHKLVWFTGLLGTVVVLLLSPVLSKTTFGNYDYTIPFIILSCILLIEQLAADQRVVLQGTRRLKDLAKSSAIGATLGLVITVPLYYAFGIRGIVPTLILNSVAGLVIFWWLARKIDIPKYKLTPRQTWDQGRQMVQMGVAMSISGILSTAMAYVIRTFIMRNGGADSVGLYQAGFVIINSYVGMVFNAIGTDFYPRLAAANKDDSQCREIVSRQGEIAVHILAPLLCVCILTMPLIIRILYSEKFVDTIPFVLWCCPGMVLRLASWLIAYQFVAKAESRLFIITEIVGGGIYLSLSLIGYKLGGLTGLGIAFSIDYILYLVFVYVVAARRYGFFFSAEFIKSFSVQLLLTIGALLTIVLLGAPYKYIACCIFTAGSCIIALAALNRKVGLDKMLLKLFPGKHDTH